MKVASFNRSSIGLAGALLFVSAAGPVLAQNTTPAASGNAGTTQSASNGTSHSDSGQSAQSAAPQKLSAHDREAVKLSEDGLTTMQSVHAARVAIFDGDPKMAKQLLSAAQTSLHAAAKDVTALQGNAKSANKGSANGSADTSATGQSTGGAQTADGASGSASGNKAEYVAIDGRMSVVDGFVVSPAGGGNSTSKGTDNSKSGGNEQDAKSGQSGAQASTQPKDGGAKENLRLAAVDATFTRVMMPLQTTTQQVDKAAQLVDQQKYYEANQALKAVEDGLVLDVVTLDSMPAGGAPKASDSHANSTGQGSAQAKPKS